MRVLCILFPLGTPLKEMAEACLRLTPQIALGDEALFLEIGKCQRLYSEESVRARVQILLKRFKLSARISVADDIPTSLAMARFNISKKENLPISCLDAYLSPFKQTGALDRMMVLMNKLGISTMREFLKVPTKTLASRFGQEALLVAGRVRDASLILWPHFSPVELIKERVDLDSASPVNHLEPLLFSAKTLVDRAMARLRGRFERASVVEFQIEQEKYSQVKEPIRIFRMELSLPQGSAVGFLLILRERLESELRKKPLEAPVIGLTLTVIEVVPSQRPQRDFFNKREEDQEKWESLVDRLREKLGNNGAFLAKAVESYIPENTWAQTLEAPLKTDLPFPSRPSRLFKEPMPLKSDGHELVAAHTRWQIIEAKGPENISGEWWLEGVERDYFQMEASTGELLWVYRDGRSNQYFLHGIFD
jgi:protein ImuB